METSRYVIFDLDDTLVHSDAVRVAFAIVADAFAISRDTLIGAEFADGMTLDDYIDVDGLPTGGAVRASLGLASNLADIERFMEFATEFCDLTSVPADLPPRLAC